MFHMKKKKILKKKQETKKKIEDAKNQTWIL